MAALLHAVSVLLIVVFKTLFASCTVLTSSINLKLHQYKYTRKMMSLIKRSNVACTVFVYSAVQSYQ